MYEGQTYEVILERALGRVATDVDKREGSLVMNALASSAVEHANLYILLDGIVQNGYAPTAEREYLILRCQERGIFPYEATKAVLKGKFNQDIPIEARFNLNDLNYTVTEFIEAVGGYYYYKLECETAGTIGNKYFGKLSPIEYVAKNLEGELVEVLIHAEDDEYTEALRKRYSASFGSIAFGGKHQQTPIQAMVHKISTEKAKTKSCSLMSWGYNPFIAEKSPFHSAYLAVIESVSKLIATGAKFEDVYLTFQEYFEKPLRSPQRWGKPLSALLGAFKAQLELEIASIGGKDSMSGSFEDIDVPPTLVSFAVTTEKVDSIVSPEFKGVNHNVCLIKPEYDENGLPVTSSLKEVFAKVNSLLSSGKAVAAYTPTYGGVAEAVMKMCFGNDIGFKFEDNISDDEIFGYNYGSFVLEMTDDTVEGILLGKTTEEKAIVKGEDAVCLDSLLKVYEDKLEPIYSCNIATEGKEIPAFSFEATERKAPAIKVAKPKVLIPVFPGTNCEYDSAKAMEYAGAEAEIIVLNNLTSDGITRSVEKFAKSLETAQMVFVPGGFSGGDEPDGSGKFITAFFRNAAVKEGVTDLLENRDGLMCGICNGFQALIKLGLVPYGKIIDTDENCPTLTFNTIGRHQSRLVRTRIASNKSPWLAATNVGDVYTVPISHGEGRFLASDELIKKLAENGQIATQYVDLEANPTDDIHFNPNNSAFAIEGITSPDGRVFGKMGHSERKGYGLYKNVDGIFDMQMFESAVKYFK